MDDEVKGQKIVAVRPMVKDEMIAEGWDEPALVLMLENGTILYASRDPEGNGPGALFGYNPKKNERFVLEPEG